MDRAILTLKKSDANKRSFTTKILREPVKEKSRSVRAHPTIFQKRRQNSGIDGVEKLGDLEISAPNYEGVLGKKDGRTNGFWGEIVFLFQLILIVK